MNHITSKDVAAHAGVSQSLVSLILNNVPGKKIKPETRELVIQTAITLGYKVNMNARNIKCNTASAIGLLSTWDPDTFVYAPVISGVTDACKSNNLAVVMCIGSQTAKGTADYIEYYLQNRIDGLLVISRAGLTEEGLISQLKTSGIPFACAIGAKYIPQVDCVDVSYFKSGYMAALHLYEMGYKQIAYQVINCKNTMNYAEKERIDGAIKGAAECGISLKVLEIPFVERFKEESDLTQALQSLQSFSFDSLISTSYECFIYMKAALQLNINIPSELGVIAIDNEVFAPYLFPSLTTINEPFVEISKIATTILIEKIKGQTSEKKLELNPGITIRKSTMKKGQ